MPFSEYLTAKQVIGLLHIDRTTLYRMLNDGRIKGVKVGNQWRFSQAEIEKLLSGSPSEEKELLENLDQEIPYQCIIPVQDVIADIAGIGILLADKEGKQLTDISNSCEFCELIRSTEKGRAACASSWKKLAGLNEREGHFTPCHAGLQYAMAKVTDVPGKLGMLIAGQFILKEKNNLFSEEHVRKLAQDLGIDENKLVLASKKIADLDERWENKIGGWLKKLAKTFAVLTRDRANFLNRFKQIMNLSMIKTNV